MGTKHKILDGFYDDWFMLIALHCNQEDHALVYALNATLKTGFKRSKQDIDIAENLAFPMFEWFDEKTDSNWSLFPNGVFDNDNITMTGLFKDMPSSAKHHLVPEHKEVDYFIKIDQEVFRQARERHTRNTYRNDRIYGRLRNAKFKEQPNFLSMPTQKKTKIVATLGPATSKKEVLKEMILAGTDVFRINFSHAIPEDVVERIAMIRELNEELGTNVSILGDLQGPKLRVGVMGREVVVSPGDEIDFVTGEPFEGTAEKVYMNYAAFPKDVKPGERVLLDDGKLMFEVVSTNGEDTVKTKVIQGGPLKSKKGVNLPNTNISLPALTEKDIEDAIFAIGQKVDWIALSFVRFEQDLIDLRKIVEEHSEHKIPIIAKIEKPEAVENIDKIVAHCDGLMVARGDLGVEVPAQEVPLIQKQLVLRAKRARIPVIIATQMMETMITSLTPTRAEVNDVANSVMDGADAVMLSGETSVGNYPVQVIEKMTSILRSVESSDLIHVPHDPPHIRTRRYITKSVCYHAAIMANENKSQGDFDIDQ